MSVETLVRGNGITITPELQTYAEERLDRLSKLLTSVDSARVELRHVPTKSGPDGVTAQITLRSGGTVVRAEELDRDAKAAIDRAAGKLDQQVRKVHSKQSRRRGDATATIRGTDVLAPPSPMEAIEAGEEQTVVRVKQVEAKPMDVEEAIEHLELLGHDFYVFRDSDANGQVSVVYKRRAGGYGVIRPDAS